MYMTISLVNIPNQSYAFFFLAGMGVGFNDLSLKLIFYPMNLWYNEKKEKNLSSLYVRFISTASAWDPLGKAFQDRQNDVLPATT